MSPLVKKYLLLDSCVVEYWLNKYIQESLETTISQWAGNNFDLAISEISYAELIDGARKEKEEKVKKLLDTFFGFTITQRVVRGCGILGSTYKTQDDTLKNMGTADKIIAATAFIHNVPIVTANVKDFPYPFFTTITSKNLHYLKEKKDHYIAVAVLRPNFQMLQYWFDQRK